MIGQSFEDDTKAPVCNSYLFYLRPSFTSNKLVVGRVAWPDDRLSGWLSLQVISHFKFWGYSICRSWWSKLSDIMKIINYDFLILANDAWLTQLLYVFYTSSLIHYSLKINSFSWWCWDNLDNDTNFNLLCVVHCGLYKYQEQSVWLCCVVKDVSLAVPTLATAFSSMYSCCYRDFLRSLLTIKRTRYFKN